MFAAEKILQALTYEELYYTLKSLVDEDCYLAEFLDNQILQDFLYLLEIYEIVFISSDERVLLTNKGEKILQYVAQAVELTKINKKAIVKKQNKSRL